MEPIDPTSRALEELDKLGETSTHARLVAMAEQAVSLVPSCVGLSLTLRDDGITLTMVSSDIATQRLDGDARNARDEAGTDDAREGDVLDEERWSLFARASAAVGVEASLTIPVVSQGEIIGDVVLYAAERGAFDGIHEEIARITSSWAPGAVTDADLSFSTRRIAEDAPARLHEQSDIAFASGIVCSAQEIEIGQAQRMIRIAAAERGISELELARAVIASYEAGRSFDLWADD